MSYSHRFRRNGKQSFPAADHSNFPLSALVSRYALNLLPYSPLHSEFLEILFTVTGVSPAKKLIACVFDRVASAEELKEILGADDVDDLVRRTGYLMEKHLSSKTEREFRVCLGEVLRTRLPPLPSSSSKYSRRIERLKQMLNLSDEDVRVLECFVCYQLDGLFENYCDQYPASDWSSLIAVALDLPKEAVRSRVVKGGSLASKGLVEMRKNAFESSDAIFEYITGIADDFLRGDEF